MPSDYCHSEHRGHLCVREPYHEPPCRSDDGWTWSIELHGPPEIDGLLLMRAEEAERLVALWQERYRACAHAVYVAREHVSQRHVTQLEDAIVTRTGQWAELQLRVENLTAENLQLAFDLGQARATSAHWEKKADETKGQLDEQIKWGGGWQHRAMTAEESLGRVLSMRPAIAAGGQDARAGRLPCAACAMRLDELNAVHAENYNLREQIGEMSAALRKARVEVVQTLPKPGERCPRCHATAPNEDNGCALCAPYRLGERLASALAEVSQLKKLLGAANTLGMRLQNKLDAIRVQVGYATEDEP